MKKIFLKVLLLSVLIQFTNFVFAQQFKALLVTRTEGWQHQSIVEGTLAMKQLAARHAFALDVLEGAGSYTINEKNLEQYQVLIFLNTTGNIFNAEQKKVIEKFIQSGKGFVGIHSASDTEYGWEWYTKLIGMMFKIHPRQQTAYLNVVDNNFPGMERFPKKLLWTDEWYEFQERKVNDLKFLVTIDEKSYDPNTNLGKENESHGMGAFHPISWYHNYDGGRAFYTALGHIPLVYSDPIFLEHVYGGIYWAATGKGL